MSDDTPTAAHPGRLGVWTSLDGMAIPDAVAFAQQIEQWGYSTLWLPEAVGRDPFALIAHLGAHTEKLTFATGIANIYARDATLYRAIMETLGDMLPGRFILGLGVSHPHLVEGFRGHSWRPPLTKMRDKLDKIGGARFMGREAAIKPPIVIAALRPKMLQLAGEHCAGAHPYLVTPEHTRRARGLVGTEAWLCPEQMLVLETDPDRARAVARGHLVHYLRAPNYQRSLLELGFSEEDWADAANASDRLVDALIGWGDVDALQKRVAEHHAAGADHVCVQPFRPDGQFGPDMAALEALAPNAS